MVSARLVLIASAAVAAATFTGQEVNAVQLRGAQDNNLHIMHDESIDDATKEAEEDAAAIALEQDEDEEDEELGKVTLTESYWKRIRHRAEKLEQKATHAKKKIEKKLNDAEAAMQALAQALDEEEVAIAQEMDEEDKDEDSMDNKFRAQKARKKLAGMDMRARGASEKKKAKAVKAKKKADKIFFNLKANA